MCKVTKIVLAWLGFCLGVVLLAVAAVCVAEAVAILLQMSP